MPLILPTTRRALLYRAAAVAGLAAAAAMPLRRVWAAPRFINDPFQLGVASGDPVPDGFVIWTRLAPDPYDPRALPDEAIEVTWEVAEDEKFRKVAVSGNVFARPERAHSVHVDVRGLNADRAYFYRFRCADVVSRTGRASTLPPPRSSPDRLRFAFASCQNYGQGYFTPFRDMIAQDPRLIAHLGDYIYEVDWGLRIRNAPVGEARTLDEYRLIHAVYKMDPDLQAAHAHCPWVFTWDDHEVDNDYAGDLSEAGDDPAVFAQRRIAAYRAYYEHLPLRAVAAPQDNGAMILFQRFNFGNLAEFNVLDLRQYRSNQACETPDWRSGRVVDISACPDINDPARTMLGPYQERWFQLNFARTGSIWTVIAHSLMMMGFDQIPGPARGAYTDNWGAYPAAKRKILDQIKARKPANVVAIGGDIHSYFVGEVKDDDADPASASLISEFVCTSITSESYNTALFESLMAENPNISFVNDRFRGYVLCDLDRTRWLSTLRVIDTVHTRDGAFRTLAAFAVENGKPGIQPAST